MNFRNLTTTNGIAGGTLFLLGIHQFGWLKENIGEMGIFNKVPVLNEVPFVKDLTPLKILGVLGIYYGGATVYNTLTE
tara:strand:+ start:604 stop:837 length:234 start_codon:yes stop_codon:yes gene_type:complete